jgi:hypothetical protein
MYRPVSVTGPPNPPHPSPDTRAKSEGCTGVGSVDLPPQAPRARTCARTSATWLFLDICRLPSFHSPRNPVPTSENADKSPCHRSDVDVKHRCRREAPEGTASLRRCGAWCDTVSRCHKRCLRQAASGRRRRRPQNFVEWGLLPARRHEIRLCSYEETDVVQVSRQLGQIKGRA